MSSLAPLAEIELEALGETILAALAGGVGVTLAFALTILGFVRMAEMNRQDRDLETLLAGILAFVSSAIWIAAIVIGLIVVAS
ncbi:MAG: hypothetical protein H0W09_01265 [Solirubrobacterales bacterium]|nr:hypothetical protein [Solirubrobacterales bacterium]